METVKIDAKKLQLLNDRISQTIDALNELKFSTHDLQHSALPQQWGAQVGGYPQPQQQLGGYPQPQQQLGGYPQPQQQLGGYPQPQQQLGGYPQPSFAALAQPQLHHLGVLPQPPLGLNSLYGTGPSGLPLSVQGAATGLEHSTPSWGRLGYGPALGQLPHHATTGPLGLAPSLPPGQLSYGMQGLGISHTGPAVDPYWQLGLQASLPYGQRAVPSMMAY